MQGSKKSMFFAISKNMFNYRKKIKIKSNLSRKHSSSIILIQFLPKF